MLYRLLSDVLRSRSIFEEEANLMLDLAASIFFRYSEAITVVVVW